MDETTDHTTEKLMNNGSGTWGRVLTAVVNCMCVPEVEHYTCQ